MPFEVDDYTRWRLMEGLDDIGLTLQNVRTSTFSSRSARLVAGHPAAR